MITHDQDKHYTADDLWKLALDGNYYELAQGTLYETTPSSELHGVIGAELLLIIDGFVKAHKLGRIYTAETGFELSVHDVLAPDVGFVSTARITKRTDKFAKVAPDLAIEVVSPSNTRVKMQEKVNLYFAAAHGRSGSCIRVHAQCMSTTPIIR